MCLSGMWGDAGTLIFFLTLYAFWSVPPEVKYWLPGLDHAPQKL